MSPTKKNTVCHWNKNHSQYTEDALACDRRQIVAPTSTSDYPATPTSMYLAERKFQAGQASSRNLARLLVSERLMASSDNDGRGWCLIITHTLRNSSGICCIVWYGCQSSSLLTLNRVMTGFAAARRRYYFLNGDITKSAGPTLNPSLSGKASTGSLV